MTNDSSSTEQSAQTEAVQAVVDRVAAWQHGATDGTVHEEIRKGLDEVGVSLETGQVDAIAEAIEADDGPVDAATLLS